MPTDQATGTPTVEELLSVHPEIQKRLQAAQIVEDVMTRQVISGGAKPTDNSKFKWIESAEGKGASAPSVSDNKYLPKGSIESNEDYQKRLKMTPFLPELPHIIADRIGAIFAEQPILDGADKEAYVDLEKSFTSEGKSMTVAAADCASWMQRVGFCGILLDRKPLDTDTKARSDSGELSQAEVDQRGLDDSKATIYRPNQILNFDTDAVGLLWVKVIEYYVQRADWRAKPEPVKIVRIIDRKQIESWKIDKEDKVSFVSAVPNDPKITGRVPFVFVPSPVDTWSMLGGSMLVESAQADVGATRLRSDICWCLFILGNPILKWWTHEEKGTLGTGASRYVQLKPGSGTREQENLEFCQLDSEGIKLQVAMLEMMRAECRLAAGRQGDAAVVDQPNQVSGVSRAWEFKTGEERVLFLITSALQTAFDNVFDMLATMKGKDPKAVKLKFNKVFDLGAPKDALDVSERVLNIVSPLNMPTARKVALHKVVDAMGPCSDEDESAIDSEIEAAAKEPVETIDPENDEESGGAENAKGQANDNGAGSGNGKDMPSRMSKVQRESN